MRKATLVFQPVATVYVQLFKDVILEVLQSTDYPQKICDWACKYRPSEHKDRRFLGC